MSNRDFALAKTEPPKKTDKTVAGVKVKEGDRLLPSIPIEVDNG